MGAAYLAGLAIGFWKSKEDVMKQWVIDKEFNVKMNEKERKKQLVKCTFGKMNNILNLNLIIYNIIKGKKYYYYNK